MCKPSSLTPVNYVLDLYSPRSAEIKPITDAAERDAPPYLKELFTRTKKTPDSPGAFRNNRN